LQSKQEFFDSLKNEKSENSSLSLNEKDIKPIEIGDFIIGIASGIENNDLSKDINLCAPSEWAIAESVEKIVEDLLKKTETGIQEALTDSKQVLDAFKLATIKCSKKSPHLLKLYNDISIIDTNLQYYIHNLPELIQIIIQNEDKMGFDEYEIQDA